MFQFFFFLHAYSHYTAFLRRFVILHLGTEVPPSGKMIAYPESPRTPQHGSLKYSDFPLPHGSLSFAACPTCAHTKAKARSAHSKFSLFSFEGARSMQPLLVSTQPGKLKPHSWSPRDGARTRHDAGVLWQTELLAQDELPLCSFSWWTTRLSNWTPSS